MNVRAETSKVIVQVPPTALIRLLIMEKLLYYAAVGGFARPSSWAKAQQVRSVRNTSRVLRRVHEQRGKKKQRVLGLPGVFRSIIHWVAVLIPPTSSRCLYWTAGMERTSNPVKSSLTVHRLSRRWQREKDTKKKTCFHPLLTPHPPRLPVYINTSIPAFCPRGHFDGQKSSSVSYSSDGGNIP